MRGASLLALPLVLLSVAAVTRAQTRQPESPAIEIARTVARTAERLVETKQQGQVRAMRADNLRAIARLRQMGRPAIEALRSALEPKNNYVTASSAAYALYLLEPAQVHTSVEALMVQMNKMMFTDDMLAQKLILAIGAPAVPTLTHHLNDSMVIQLLGAMGSNARSAVPALKGVLGTKNVEVAATLAAIGTPDAINAAVPVLIDALKDPNNPNASSAVIALGNLKSLGRVAIPEVRQTLRSTNPDTRLYAAIALADMGDTENAVGALSTLIQNKDLHGRFAAIQKLGSLGPKAKSAVPALVTVISDSTDKRYGDRAMAATALTKIDPNSAETKAVLRKATGESMLKVHMEKQGLRPQL